MNEYVIFTTEGNTFSPNPDISINNCQLLGRAIGENYSMALENLYKENPWINQAEFRKSECFGIQILSTSQKDDIKKVIEYLWQDEHKHYAESHSKKNHIFHLLKRLNSMLVSEDSGFYNDLPF